MSFMLPWSLIWIALFAVAGVLELCISKLYAWGVMPASLIALVLSLFEIKWWIQLAVFVGVAAIFLLFVCPLLAKKRSGRVRAFDVDSLIGTKCAVTSRIENVAGNGEVVVDGLYWAARSAEEDTVYEVGAQVTVIAIEGVKLICR